MPYKFTKDGQVAIRIATCFFINGNVELVTYEKTLNRYVSKS